AASHQPAGEDKPKTEAVGPVSATPSQTAEVFGNWTMQCANAATGTGSVQVCGVVETIQANNSDKPIAKLFVSRDKAANEYSFGAVLPVNVTFPSKVSLTGDNKASIAELEWARCTPGGCLALVDINAATLKQWEASSNQPVLAFKLANGQTVSIPTSVKGLAQAVAAIPKN
ncbi:MAG: hypothetical protein B7Z81_08955, partial [Acidocella sp. 20-61-6]